MHASDCISAHHGNSINLETSTKRQERTGGRHTWKRIVAIYFIVQTEITVQSQSSDEDQDRFLIYLYLCNMYAFNVLDGLGFDCTNRKNI